MDTIRRLLAVLAALCGATFTAQAGPVYEPVAAFQAGPKTPGSGSLLLHSDGNFYGTAAGGAANAGAIYKVTPAGQVSVLVHFTGTTGPAKGKNPQGALVSDGSGLLWGTTAGDNLGNAGTDYGTVFNVNPTTGALTTVVEFTGPVGPAKGARPSGALVSDGNGFFWGATAGDQGFGPIGYGTIFKVKATTGALI